MRESNSEPQLTSMTPPIDATNGVQDRHNVDAHTKNVMWGPGQGLGVGVSMDSNLMLSDTPGQGLSSADIIMHHDLLDSKVTETLMDSIASSLSQGGCVGLLQMDTGKMFLHNKTKLNPNYFTQFSLYSVSRSCAVLVFLTYCNIFFYILIGFGMLLMN